MRSFAFAIDPLSGSQTQRTSLVWVFLFGEALAFVDFAMRDHSVLQHDSNSHLAKKSILFGYFRKLLLEKPDRVESFRLGRNTCFI